MAEAVGHMAVRGVVTGRGLTGDGKLNPNGQSTRAEGAQFLYNILKYDAK